MGAWGMQVFADDGATVVWDSSTVAGGVIAHVGVYQATDTAMLTFPEFAGRSAQIVPDFGWFYNASDSVAVDTTLGYPRLTVTASTGIRRFYLVVY